MPTTLEAVRAEALFVWCLQAPYRPAADNVREAVSTTLRRLGSGGCAALVAEEFGAYPDTAVNRMTWALAMVHDVYPATTVDVTPADVTPADVTPAEVTPADVTRADVPFVLAFAN